MRPITALTPRNTGKALLSALILALCWPAVTFAATCSSAPSTINFQTTSDVECKQSGTQYCRDVWGKQVSVGSGSCKFKYWVCADGSNNPVTGPLTACVLAGDDPPVSLRPDNGIGMTFLGLGSTTHGGKCPPPGNGIGTTGTPSLGDFRLKCPINPSSNSASSIANSIFPILSTLPIFR